MHRARVLLSTALFAAVTLTSPSSLAAQTIAGMSGPTITINTPHMFGDDYSTWIRTWSFTPTGFHIGFNGWAAFDRGVSATFNFTLAGGSTLNGVNFDGCMIGGGLVQQSYCNMNGYTGYNGFQYGANGINQNAGPNALWGYGDEGWLDVKLYGNTVQVTSANPGSSVGFAPADLYFNMTQAPQVVPEPATVGLMGTGLLLIGALARRKRRA